MAYIGQTPTAVPLVAGDISDDAIDSQHYAAGSIDTAHLADDQITLAKMAAGTDGNIISYDASGNPVAIATGSDGQVLTSTGAGSAPAFEALPAGGKVVQVVNVQTGAVATGTTALPNDDTIPQKTEGDEFMTLAITPTSASNKLKIEVVCSDFSNTVGTANVTIALFQDSTAGALAAWLSSKATAYEISGAFTHFMTAGTTSSTTFKIRMGCTGGGTTTFNGVSAGRMLGGVLASSITITEISV